MKHLSSLVVTLVIVAAISPVAVAQEDAGGLPRPATRTEDPSDAIDAFGPSYELQFRYGRAVGVSLGVPLGSYVHLEAGVGGYDIAMQFDDGVDEYGQFGAAVTLRIDMAAPTTSLRPFVRLGGDLWRGKAYASRWAQWDVRITAGAQVRLKEHFGIEVEAGGWYGRLVGDESGRGFGFQYGLAMVIYI